MRLATFTLLAGLLGAAGLAGAQTTTPAAQTGKPAAGTASMTTAAPAAAATPASTGATTPHGKMTAAPAAGSADAASAKQKCGTDSVVWGNSESKVYHTTDSRYYGKTKKGSFMCLKDATAAGFHASKSSVAHVKKPAGTS